MASAWASDVTNLLQLLIDAKQALADPSYAETTYAASTKDLIRMAVKRLETLDPNNIAKWKEAL